MTFEDGEVKPLSKEEWRQLLLQKGTSYWGSDLPERDSTSIHQFYEPFSDLLAELEQELKAVNESSKIETAENGELDRIGSRYNIERISAERAQGTVEFSRSTDATVDYSIQQGTVVETGGQDSIRFETTEAVTLQSGTKSVTASIRAINTGSRGNVAANTITEAPVVPAGVESITNPNPTQDGRNRELDDSYRSRLKRSLGDIEGVSGFRSYKRLTSKQFVKEIKFYDNSESTASGNLNAHEFEFVVDAEPGHSDEIAQIIFEDMPMGGNIQSGNYGSAKSGTATLPNGQTFDIVYSEPTAVDIYVDVTVDAYSDIDENDIKNEIVEYIGGIKTNGEYTYGDLTIGDDVLYGEVDFAVRSLNQVHDVPSLNTGTSSSPTGTSDIAISETERPTIDASNINATVQVI